MLKQCASQASSASPCKAVRVVAILAFGVIFDQTAQDVDVRQSTNLWPQIRLNCGLRAADGSIVSVIVSAIVSIFLYLTAISKRVAPRRTTMVQRAKQRARNLTARWDLSQRSDGERMRWEMVRLWVQSLWLSISLSHSRRCHSRCISPDTSRSRSRCLTISPSTAHPTFSHSHTCCCSV